MRYGRFMPQASDRDQWEKGAEQRNVESLDGAKKLGAAFQGAFHNPRRW